MKSRIPILLSLLMFAMACHSQDNQPAGFGPGFYLARHIGGAVSAPPALPLLALDTGSDQPMPGGSSAIAEAITPRISTLARSLQNDPTLIYNYVHDHIRYAHYFGSHKGATMTLLEGCGNDFDQCALLVALLTASGYSPTYQFGTVEFPYSADNNQDYQHWVGATMPDTDWDADVQLADNINGDCGFPVTWYGDQSNMIVFQHVWVQVTVGATTYTLDPSFKVNQFTSGINVDLVAGISTNKLLTDAAGTAMNNYVQYLQENALRNDLTACTTNLLNYIQTNCPNASALQVFGGQTITPSAGQPLPAQTAFTIETYDEQSPLATWQYIPTNLMAVLIVTLPGTTNSTNVFYIPGLAADRLSLVCASNGIAQLWQEDTTMASVQTTGGANAFFSIDLTIQHPFGTNWDFSEGTFYPARFAGDDQDFPETCLRTNATYNIAYGFDPGPAWLTARQRQLDACRQHGCADTSRQVVSETLNVMSLTYMEQEELIQQYVARQLTNIPSSLHILGLMCQETGYGYHIDLSQVLDATSGQTTNDNSQIEQNQDLEVSAYFMSGLENAVIEQLQSSNLLAASTVKMLELASTNGQQIFLANSANWNSIKTSLSGYDMNYLTGLIASNCTLLLPQNGSIPLDGANSWTGQGFVVLEPLWYGLYASPMLISGGYNGGFSEYPWVNPSPSDIAAIDANQSTYVNEQSPTAGTQTQNNGDPVSMVDGSFQITSGDLSLGGTEPRGLNLTRYYTSSRRNLNLSGMAPGWLHNYYCTASAQSAWQSALGGPTPQTMAPMVVAMRTALDVYNSTQWTPKNMMVTALIAKWGSDQLIKNAVSVNLGNQTIQFLKQPNGAYTPPANCTMTLTQTNGACYLQERHGRTFAFNTNSLLTNIADQYGRSMKFAYNSQKLLTNVTDWTNRALTFTYTASNLTSVSDGTRTIHYGYTGPDLTSYTDPDGNTFTYQYDTNHQVIATLDALNRLVVTNNYDLNGHITTQLTQGATNKLWQVYATGWQTTLIDPMGGRQNYYFDDQSRQTAYQDALGNLTQTCYDGQDHVTNTISPLNETNQFIYDSSNNLIQTIDPLGFSNAFVFDSQNRMTTSIDARGNSSHFGYNAQFSPTGVTNGNGDWSTLAYNADGTLQSRTDSSGTTGYTYDSTYGQPNSITYPGSLGSEGFLTSPAGDVLIHTNALNYATTFSYNNRRQLTNTIAPTNLTTKATFDANANLSTTTDARGNVTSNNWSVTRHLLGTTFPLTPQGTPVIANTYDPRDWLASTQNPLGKTTYYTNDPAHRLIAATDPLQRTTLLAYDSDSHPTNTTDAAWDQTAQYRDARGSVTRTIDAATNTVGRAYDAAGNLIFLTNRNGKLWQFQYDAANRLTNTLGPLGHGITNSYNNRGLLAATTNALGQPTLFGYDAKARLTGKADNLGTINYQYDANNNLTLLTNLGTGTKLSWAYDAYNRAISFTNAAGYIIQYRYDNNGNLTNLIYPGNLTVKYYYDSNNRLTNVTDWTSKQTTFAYDLAGHLTGITRPNNTLRSLSYDDDGELTNIVEQTTTKYPICFYTLNYNAAGRVQWEFKGPLPHAFTPPTRSMTYDADNRLSAFNGASVTIDNDGNLTYAPLTNNTFGTYTYDARNELTSAGGISYGYDPEGNRTSFTNGSTNTTFVVDPKTSQTLMRIKNGVTNYYIYGKGILYEIDVTATTTATAYYHYDSRGSTVTLTDSNGNPTDMVEYSPYGTTTYRYGTNDTPFLFNGRFGVQTDPNGLLYMRARYYNPYISRFLNSDPSRFAGGLNFYLFCNGNPISEADPFGLYGYSTAYWADLSVTGSWWQQIIAVPLGVLSAAVPDAVAVSVNGTVGFNTGGTVGVQSVGFVQEGTGASYSFAGATPGTEGSPPGLVTPDVSAGFTISVAWSSDYNPSSSSWTGDFTEENIGVGVLGVNGFQSGTWTGVGIGGSVGPAPVSASYFNNVNYQLLTPQGNDNAPSQGAIPSSAQSPNNSSTGK